MTKSDLHNYYSQRVEQFKADAKELVSKTKLIAWIRVLFFIFFIIGFVWLVNAREMQVAIILTIVFVPIFGFIVKKHRSSQFALRQKTFLAEINQNEIKRLAGDLSELEQGSTPDPLHPYAIDLDVFGSNSLFQLLTRTKLEGSSEVMKSWLLNPAIPNIISERHEALKELAPEINWRQSMTAYGYHTHEKDSTSIHALIIWFKNNLNDIDKPIWKVLQYVMPTLSTILIIGWWQLGWNYQLLFIPILTNLLILKFIFKPLMDLTTEFDKISNHLKSYVEIIKHVESKSFESKLLIRLAEKLKRNNQLASKAIHSLNQTLNFLLNRANMLYVPLNTLFLLDMIALQSALRWKKKNLDSIENWFSSIHEIDALNDLSAYAFSNPGFTYPQIIEKSVTVEAENLGHPLIKPNQRTINNFKQEGKGSLGLVTGSNMSGKSTFLRTVGVNLVLAQCGAPVCATQFVFSPINIFTSMRTQDNLEENVSSFYAELRRLKQMLESLDSKTPTFYLLDEILKGTNSEDRHKGAMSLIDQLIAQNCTGLISTHDIQLAELSKNQPKIKNYSFNSTVSNDEIIFDYKLTDGPCKNFNASKLMEKMGIIKNQKS